MAKQPSNGPLIAAVGVALLLLLGANIMAQKNNPEIAEKLEKEKEAQEMAKASSSPPPTAVAMGGASGGNELVALGDQTILGNKNSKTKIVVGYSWTPEVQGNPGSIYQAVTHLQQMASSAAIEVVNVDQHPEAKVGISVNGATIVPAGQDGTLQINQNMMRVLMQTIQHQPTQP